MPSHPRHRRSCLWPAVGHAHLVVARSLQLLAQLLEPATGSRRDFL